MASEIRFKTIIRPDYFLSVVLWVLKSGHCVSSGMGFSDSVTLDDEHCPLSPSSCNNRRMDWTLEKGPIT